MTSPDVHHISTYRAGGIHADLGFVDTDGVYHFANGRRVLANGDALDPTGTKVASNAVVLADGTLRRGDGPQDGLDAAANTANAKHSVDSRYQDAYDADTDLTPAEVFAAVDDA
ncbi:hypothetical protein [Gordonia aquimaris]|uniref:Uncharacterized protein n=1 Tax=Gordonia aquimaris TaxID=2984863 RepID=A0A9X3D613_9ACTN|nr:hypothetical protein [Gordonia aquimaris]MCX2965603.1 hypothetical protein [Gordonia aquimaris]